MPMGGRQPKPAIASSDSKPTKSLSAELGKWVEVLREQWMSPIDETLPRWKRFCFAFAGSFTFFSYLFFGMVLIDDSTAVRQEIDVIPVANRAIIGSFFCSWFAYLISWMKVSYSPTRLYLSGFSLPAIITTVLFRIFQTLEVGG